MTGRQHSRFSSTGDVPRRCGWFGCVNRFLPFQRCFRSALLVVVIQFGAPKVLLDTCYRNQNSHLIKNGVRPRPAERMTRSGSFICCDFREQSCFCGFAVVSWMWSCRTPQEGRWAEPVAWGQSTSTG